MVTKEEIELYLKTQSPWKDHPNCWYQEGIELPHGIITKSYANNADCREVWKLLHIEENDIKGKSVLDIGCNTGYYAMRCKEMGAGRVVAMDISAWLQHGVRFAEWKGIEIEWAFKDFHNFDWTQKFDLVFAL